VDRFKDKTVLVTGATSGIGRETALAFAREGANVVAAGRRKREGAEVVAEIEALGARAIFVETDVSREADVSALVKAAVKRFGRLDVAFNNAGTEGTLGATVDQTVENYRTTFDINVLGVLLSMKYEIPALAKAGGGAIINNASIAGVVGMPGGAVYMGTKHAVLGMTKCTALEVAKENIRVNAVSPGPIETAMFDRFAASGGPDTRDHITSAVPMGRAGTSAEISGAVLFLASADATYITGQHIVIDGGYTVP
jgi:NAD(P)-dependent dehydrogenase (short-subunit alcohol dehydrogenase family)